MPDPTLPVCSLPPISLFPLKNRSHPSLPIKHLKSALSHHWVNEAAINAVKCGRKAISQDDLMEAVEVVIAGKEKKDRILSKEEKKIVVAVLSLQFNCECPPR